MAKMQDYVYNLAMAQKLNILFITARSDMGGGSKHLFDLCTYYKGHHPEIGIFIAAPDELPFGTKYKEISSGFFTLKSRSFSVIKLFNLWLFCRKHQITLIHSHGRGAGIYSRLLKLAGFTIIHTFHGVHLQKSISSLIKHSIDKFLCLLTDHFICVSSDEQKKATALGLCHHKNSTVIPNGIILFPITKTPHSGFTIGTLSRFDHQKGLDIELRGIAHFKKKYPRLKFKLLIAGNGEEFSKINQLREELSLSNEVELLGQTEDPHAFLMNLDLYLSFSRGEGLPLAVLEAMGAEVPCLLSNVQGHKELAEDGCAMLFDLFDFESFSHQLKTTIENEALRNELAKKGKLKITQSYTTELMCTKTLNLYHKINICP